MKLKIELELECESAAFRDDSEEELFRIIDDAIKKAKNEVSKHFALRELPSAEEKLFDVEGADAGKLQIYGLLNPDEAHARRQAFWDKVDADFLQQFKKSRETKDAD